MNEQMRILSLALALSASQINKLKKKKNVKCTSEIIKYLLKIKEDLNRNTFHVYGLEDSVLFRKQWSSN